MIVTRKTVKPSKQYFKKIRKSCIPSSCKYLLRNVSEMLPAKIAQNMPPPAPKPGGDGEGSIPHLLNHSKTIILTRYLPVLVSVTSIRCQLYHWRVRTR